MTRMRHLNYSVTHASFLLAMLLSQAVCVAQVIKPTGSASANGLDVACELGFADLCDVARPTSLSLLMSNYTGKPIDGRLFLTDKWSGFEIDLESIFLSEQQTRRFGSIVDLSQWNDAKVDLRDLDGNRLWHQDLLLQKNLDNSESKNVVLMVGDGSRKLEFAPVALHTQQQAPSSNYNRRYRYRYGYGYGVQQQQIPTTKLGTPVQSINAATWQLPTHHAPLLPVRAMLFTESANADRINSGQWKAIAEWMCLGGHIFVDRKAQEFIEEILKASPLSDEPAMQVGNFSVRRVGLGAFYEFNERLFKGDSAAAEQKVVAVISRLTPRHLSEVASVSSLPRERRQPTDRNRLQIIILFLVYTLLSGVVVLAMFRRTRRQVATYVVAVVTLAAIGAGILGANLRYSKGDLRWVTISQPGAGGGVQVARLEAKSSGARSSAVTLSGVHPDLQVTSADENNYWLQHQVQAFSQQQNQLKSDQAFRTNVKITPWGRRRLYATDFDTDMKRLGCEIEIDDKRQLTLKVTNHLSVDIQSCKVVIMATSDGNETRLRFHQVHDFATIAAGQSSDAQIRLQFAPFNGNDELVSFRETQYLSPPVLNQPNAVSAWIIAKLSGSPSLRIDEERSDFRTNQKLHLLAQEVLPEKLPDYSQFGPFPKPPLRQIAPADLQNENIF